MSREKNDTRFVGTEQRVKDRYQIAGNALRARIPTHGDPRNLRAQLKRKDDPRSRTVPSGDRKYIFHTFSTFWLKKGTLPAPPRRTRAFGNGGVIKRSRSESTTKICNLYKMPSKCHDESSVSHFSAHGLYLLLRVSEFGLSKCSVGRFGAVHCTVDLAPHMKNKDLNYDCSRCSCIFDR